MKNQASRSIGAACVIVGLGTLAMSGASARAANAYNFTVNATTSTLTYSFNSSAPFAGTMIGENDPLKAANQQTRTKRFTTFFGCGTFSATDNQTVNVSGTIAATGSSTGSTALHPSGTFKLGINPAAGTSVLQDFSVNLVGSGMMDTTANLNGFTYQSFCAINPSCTAPFLSPVTLSLGTVSVTSLLASQAPGTPESGTLTAAGANQWNFSVPCTLTITPTVVFGGSAVPADPQTVASVFAGTITVTGSTASITGSATINYNPPTNTTPSPQPPTAMAVPATSALCPGINLIMTITINSSTVGSNNTANLIATGPRIVCKCDTNSNGVLEVQDIFDFLNLWFAGDPRGDFNGNGLTVQDIFDFLSCWFASPLGC
jgi:hypothetical protein